MSSLADDEMIVDFNAEGPRGVHNLACHLYIGI